MQTEHRWRPDAAALETVACPLCGGRQFQRLATTDRYDMGLVTVGCTGCGLVMTNPQPTEAALDSFYRDHYRHYYQKVDTPSLDYIRQYRKDERAGHTAAFLAGRGLLQGDPVVVDIGASEGCILKAIADLAPRTRRIAIEPNPVFGAFAVQHAGCTLLPSMAALQADAPSGVGLIVINHVYEHVKDPVRFLADLAPLLSPTGRIYIDVPDVNQYRLLDSLHIAHLYHFGHDSLRHAAARAGYEVDLLEAHQPVMHPLSLRCILRRAAQPPVVQAPANRQEGWDAVRQSDRQAWRAHRRRWSLLQRLRHRLAG